MFSKILQGVSDATIREITGHMFDHFLAAIIALLASGHFDLSEILQIAILIALVILIIKVARINGHGEKCEAESKK